jgi:hypothetical protein
MINFFHFLYTIIHNYIILSISHLSSLRIDNVILTLTVLKIVCSLFNEFVCNLGFFWHEWASLKGPRMPKKAQITQERVEYNVFLFDERPKDSKSLKIFKISLTFRFDKLSNLSKSVHTGENSQILTVSNKKNYFETIKTRQFFFDFLYRVFSKLRRSF